MGSHRPDYSGVTERPGDQISREAASMAVSRYELARQLSVDKRVLEIACGSGQGLGYVGEAAARIVGGDIMASHLLRARRHYGDRIPLVQFDAHHLPFADGSFDVVQLHEAVYYLARPADVFRDCRRVLSPHGVLVVSTINPAWPDFNPSPYADAYLRAEELVNILGQEFGRVEIRLGFPVSTGARPRLVSLLKRTAVRFRLIPRTMQSKRLLKRAFLGPLSAVPPELSRSFAPVDCAVPATGHSIPGYKVVYAIASR